MSGDADTNDVTQVRELRRVFEESASQEMRTMQEMDRNICDVTDYIEQMQRFFIKKSSEIKDLRKKHGPITKVELDSCALLLLY